MRKNAKGNYQFTEKDMLEFAKEWHETIAGDGNSAPIFDKLNSIKQLGDKRKKYTVKDALRTFIKYKKVFNTHG